MLQRMRQVDEVGLGRIVEERGHDRLRVASVVPHEIADVHRVLRHRVEDAAVAPEAALVRQRLGDVLGIDLARIGLERVDPPA
jgi:hypothetical protein